ncbi:MAG TPA: hypothetical protein VGR16_08470 [Thermomicrobiales bacterium]|nr:hypothetical protein [Thermomicrobiales bacterium]
MPYSPANPGWSRSRGQLSAYRAVGGGSDLTDPFAEQPVRRSAVLVAISAVIVFAPVFIGGAVGTTILLSIGWLGLTGLVMGMPILIWSLAEEGWRILQRQMRPPVDVLHISPRVAHVLHRHGYVAIRDVDLASDDALLCLSNMDERGLRDVRRAIGLWKYQRWQERGFPVSGRD